MEPDDLGLWYAEDEEEQMNLDDVADYVFLFDNTVTWKRFSETEILIENRSRMLTIEAADEEAAWNIIKIGLKLMKISPGILNFHVKECVWHYSILKCIEGFRLGHALDRLNSKT